jgi:hypothetical protein
MMFQSNTVDNIPSSFRSPFVKMTMKRSRYVVSAMDLGSLHAPHGSIHSVAKDALGARVALAIQASAGDTSVIWSGPKATSAEWKNSTHILVRFTVLDGAGGLVLADAESCPATMLQYYCTGHGFEVQGSGDVWAPVISAAVDMDGRSVLLEVSVEFARRVRYAYSDWPLVMLRNRVGDLPARLFDLAIANHRGASTGEMYREHALALQAHDADVRNGC